MGGSWAFSAGAPPVGAVGGSTRAPVSSAAAICGEFLLSAWIPGRRSANSAALCRRKVLIRGEVWIRVSNVGGVSVMVSWMNGLATDANAPNVVSRTTNMWAWVWATGATSAAAFPASRKKRASPVLLEARFRATGSRRRSSGRSCPIAALIWGPRPARTAPNSTRFWRTALLVGPLNMPRTWSYSTGCGLAALSGSVDPSG